MVATSWRNHHMSPWYHDLRKSTTFNS